MSNGFALQQWQRHHARVTDAVDGRDTYREFVLDLLANTGLVDGVAATGGLVPNIGGSWLLPIHTLGLCMRCYVQQNIYITTHIYDMYWSNVYKHKQKNWK
jgi:hypothetical protein